MKKMNLTLKCVLVMILIMFVSVSLLAVANAFLIPAKSTGLNDKVKDIIREFCPADNYEDLSETYAEAIEKFNNTNGTSTDKVNGVYKAAGGVNDGCLIIESEAAGYDSGIVTMLTSFGDSAITGIGVRNYDPKNSYWKSHIQPNLEKIKEYFIGKKGADLGDADSFKTQTGSTAAKTNNAILTSVTLAARFYLELGGETPQPQKVTDEKMLSLLKIMSGEDSTFIQYPYIVGGQVKNVIIDNDNNIIFNAVASEGTYGGCNLLVMVDITDKSVIKVVPVSMDYYVADIYDASVLDNAEILTNHFFAKKAEDIDSMDKYLAPSTHVTESNLGIKKCIKNALNNIDGFITSQWGKEVNK